MNIKNFKTLLFINKGTKRTIFKNTSWLALGEGVSRLFMLLLLIYAARILGPSGFGVFSFALAFASIFLIFSNFGLADIATRELARNRKGEQEYTAILSLKILLSILAFALIVAASFFITPNEGIRKIIWILGIYILTSNFLMILYSFFRARQRMEYEAGVRILQAVMIAGIGFFVLIHVPSVESLSYALLGATLITAILTLVFFLIVIKPVWVVWNLNVWKKFLKLSWPLGLAFTFTVIYIHIGSVMMGFWGQITEVGWYNAAYKIIGVLIVPATLISTSFYPVLSKLFYESKEKFQRTVNFQTELMIILAIPVMTGGLMLAPDIINFFYGVGFSPSVLVFQILAIMTGLSFLYNSFYLTLLASNQQKKVFWITFIGAITNIILNLILIPKYSLYGAAVATLITYLLLLILAIEFSRRFVPLTILNRDILNILTISIILSIIIAIVITCLLIFSVHILGIVAAGIIVYLGVLIFFFKKGFMGINLKHWITLK